MYFQCTKLCILFLFFPLIVSTLILISDGEYSDTVAEEGIYAIFICYNMFTGLIDR